MLLTLDRNDEEEEPEDAEPSGAAVEEKYEDEGEQMEEDAE